MNKEEFMEKLSAVINLTINEMYDQEDPRFILITFPKGNLSNFDVLASIDKQDFVNWIDATYNEMIQQRTQDTQH